MLTIVSCLSSPNIFLRPKEKIVEATDAHSKFVNLEGDHLTIMNAFHEYLRKNMDVDWCFNKIQKQGKCVQSGSTSQCTF